MTSWLATAAEGFSLRPDFWPSGIVLLHAVADGVIAASFLMIPAALLYIHRQRGDSNAGETTLITLFAFFILAVGLTHLALSLIHI